MLNYNSGQDETRATSTVGGMATEEDFDIYYDQYSRAIYAFLNQYIRKQQDKEDLLQEIFVKFWNSRADIRTALHAKNWLYKTARTTAFDFLARKKISDQFKDDLELLKDDNYFEVVSMASEGLNWIYETLRKLPKSEQEVIKWWLVDGLTMEEIARIRDTSVKTVYNQRSNGLSKLRDILGQSPDMKVALLFCILNLFEEAF